MIGDSKLICKAN